MQYVCFFFLLRLPSLSNYFSKQMLMTVMAHELKCKLKALVAKGVKCPSSSFCLLMFLSCHTLKIFTTQGANVSLLILNAHLLGWQLS